MSDREDMRDAIHGAETLPEQDAMLQAAGFEVHHRAREMAEAVVSEAAKGRWYGLAPPPGFAPKPEDLVTVRRQELSLTIRAEICHALRIIPGRWRFPLAKRIADAITGEW